MSKESQKLYGEIDTAMEEFQEAYDEFYDDDKKKAAKDCRKALQTLIVAAKELRKVIQVDKTGGKKKVKPEKKKKVEKKKVPAKKKPEKKKASAKKSGKQKKASTKGKK